MPTEAEPARVMCGDALAFLAGLPADSVHCCVTSPPYYGLRDYGVDGQIGLEPTPEEYVARLVAVFREVRRVLRPDGTLWLNLGDSYNAFNGNRGKSTSFQAGTEEALPSLPKGSGLTVKGLKNKDLLGIPWLVAFALRADGWYLRQDIIWAKPNPMPESIRDRCTKSHEYLFLLAKSPAYFFDAEAIKEPASGTDERPQQRRAKELFAGAGLTEEHLDAIRAAGATDAGKAITTQDGTGKNAERVAQLAAEAKRVLGGYYREFLMAATRNRRSVWRVASKPYKGAHFATFPPKLIEPCILAGTSAEGVCPKCGAPWTRQVSRKRVPTRPGADTKVTGVAMTDGNRDPLRHVTAVETTGWQPGCKCDAGPPVPAVVLDPFMGSGTVAAVALENGRRAVGCELNPDYIKLIHDRLAMVTPSLFTGLEG